MNFLTFPSDLIVDQILPFLTLKEIARIDSSATNHAKREEWINSLSKIQCFESYPCTMDSKYFPLLVWIFARKVRFGCLSINWESTTRFAEFLLDRNFDGNLVSSLTIVSISMKDEVAIRFLTRFTQVKSLKISMALNGNILHQLLRVTVQLKSLQLGYRVPHHTLAGHSHPNLEELTLSNCKDLNCEDVVAYVAQARHLRCIVANEGATDALLYALLQSQAVVPEQSAELLHNYSAFEDNRNDAQIVSATHPKLQSVSLHNSKFITQSSLITLSMRCKALVKLRLYKCSGVTEDSLSAIGQNCSMLEIAHFDECLGVSDIGVIAISEGCPRLRSVSLIECSGITDASILSLAENCPHLTCLNIFWCSLITDHAVHTVLQKCAKLQILSLCGCSLTASCFDHYVAISELKTVTVSANNFTKEEIKQLGKMYSFLRFIG